MTAEPGTKRVAAARGRRNAVAGEQAEAQQRVTSGGAKVRARPPSLEEHSAVGAEGLPNTTKVTARRIAAPVAGAEGAESIAKPPRRRRATSAGAGEAAGAGPTESSAHEPGTSRTTRAPRLVVVKGELGGTPAAPTRRRTSTAASRAKPDGSEPGPTGTAAEELGAQ